MQHKQCLVQQRAMGGCCQLLQGLRTHGVLWLHVLQSSEHGGEWRGWVLGWCGGGEDVYV